MKPTEVDYVFIGTGIAPLLSAFKLRGTAASFFLLNPLPDYFQENLDLNFDPDWPITSASELPLSFEEQARQLEEFFPGSIERQSLGKKESSSSPAFLQKDHLFLSGENSDAWLEVEAAFLKNYDLLKPQQLSHAQALRLFPGVNQKSSLFAGNEVPENDSKAFLFPKTGVLDLVPYRSGIYEFLRENHADQIRTLADPIVFHPGWIQYQTPKGPETIVVKKSVVIFWSPGISTWFQKMLRQQDLKSSPLPKRQLIEDFQIVSKEPIQSSCIGTQDHFSSWLDFHKEGKGSEHSLLRVIRKVKGTALFSEESFLELKHWVTDFLHWDYFRIRAMTARSYSLSGSGAIEDLWKTENYLIQTYYSADGNILRSIGEVNRWLKKEGLTPC
jgi:hypothetical protein